MSKFLKILAPAGAGALGVLGSAYMLADQFVVDIPAPVRGSIVVAANAATEDTTGTEEASVSAEPMAEIEQVEMMLQSPEGGFSLGREALSEEVAAWDIDVRPDGLGLPEGSGDVFMGEEIYLENCAMCHGDFGEAIGRWPVLAGGEGTLDGEDPVKTVGSYWPYASTIFDYIHRAMPFGNAQSLTDDEVYALTAYVLYLNYLVEDDFVLNRETFAEVPMPNQDNFFMDDRAEVELGEFSKEACMENCKDTVEIVKRARVLDVTPEAAESDETQENAAEETTEQMAAAETTQAVDEASEETTDATDAIDPELAAAGETVFRKCRACHQVGEGASNRVGPHLNAIIGRSVGSVEGFRYSSAMQDAGGGGLVWSEESLGEFLTNPRDFLAGTKMSFAGLRDEGDVAAIIAYLGSMSE
ncbi:c-type cytochrome [Pseudohalocynthiibacter aestuariivivens]|uniref:C-type cytochrome n=1 Tax=Pseudohalocynthiibacter aestuariivivens TaxID=1591409 RepID=A0ABV5JIW2_9RHOB|nr:c-type cytochrome [Pseudohalocynthiibacter aestuariivivens]MBS9718119.1 c-type cytochrome [Pseudohalocynthiibacter aestuariivivens]